MIRTRIAFCHDNLGVCIINTIHFVPYCSIGDNIKLLLDRPDGTYCFRLHKDRVFYVR